jgi:uncharacterized membrane protein
LEGAVFAHNLPARRSSLLQVAMVAESPFQVLTMQLAAGFTRSKAELHFSARS